MKRRKKLRTPDETKVQVQMRLDTEFLRKVDARRRQLGLNRTQYVVELAKADIEKGGNFEIVPDSPSFKAEPPRPPTAP